MHLTAIGLNHDTAPLPVREQIAFTADRLPEAVRRIVSDKGAREAVILSTCNRTELYCVGRPPEIIDWIAQYHGIRAQEFSPYLYTLNCPQTVRHAFRVSCGLDSMVLGEPQILGQLKDAVRVAQEQSGMQTVLNALFQKTFSVAKEVRSATSVGDNPVSIASAALKRAREIFPDLSAARVLFIGAGEMNTLVATHFASAKPAAMTFINRTLARARALHERLPESHVAPWRALPDMLAAHDIVISCTASAAPIIRAKTIAQLSARRRLFIDLAVPRNIEALAQSSPDITFFTIDDLAQVVDSSLALRSQGALEAESIISARVQQFIDWQQSRQAVPLIRNLREDGESARLQVLETARKQLAKGVPAEEVLERLSVQLTNKLLHPPTHILNRAAHHAPDIVQAVQSIYRLRLPEE